MKRVPNWWSVPLLLAVAPLAVAQDLAASAGSQAKVLLDNPRVRVLELVTEPGARTGVHSHGEHFVYFVTDGVALQSNADGTTTRRPLKAGELMWSGAVTHDTENAGDTAVKTLIVELKDE